MRTLLRLVDPPTFDQTLPEGGEVKGRAFPGRRYEVGDCWYATKDGDAWCIFPDGPLGQIGRAHV